MRILIDTNVLIDLLLIRVPFDKSAEEIIRACKTKKIDGCIAAQTVLNTFYILRKEYADDVLRNILRSFCDFLDVVGIDKKKITVSLNNADFSDFEDCVQAECAAEFSADYIVTRNIKDFQHSLIPAITPDEFSEKLKGLSAV